MKRHLIVLATLMSLALTGLAPAARAQTTDAILDSLQLGAFRFAWYEANPSNGLIKDRSQPGSPCSIAATGFGLTAICIGVDHAWVTRADAAARVLLTLQTFWNGPQGTGATGFIGYRGLFYHFLDMFTATRTWDSEVSTIDTALLLAGMLDARQYFNGVDATETQIRTLVDQIYQRAEWNFWRNPTTGRLRHKWRPENGYGTDCGGQPCEWTGYNEAMILYILAAGSPTLPLTNPASAWTAWTSTYNYSTQFGQTFVRFPPLFGHQYSHCWVDFRLYNDSYMTTRGLTYFENSRRATLAQRAYAIAAGISNPAKAYTDSLWGLTASDEPPNSGPYLGLGYTGYSAHGAPPAQDDDGTITPTAPISSIAFAPNETIPVIHKLWQTYKTQMWGFYGFKDAMNLLVNPDWFDTDVLGIDQGPITIMIENHRTGAVWERFMQAPEIVAGLQALGFVGPLDVPAEDDPRLETLSAAPNPFATRATLSYRLSRPGHVRLTVFDVGGRVVERLVDEVRGAGQHVATLEGARLASGVYRARLEADGQVTERTLVRLH